MTHSNDNPAPTMRVFESREAAELYALKQGGGHVYRLFDYPPGAFECFAFYDSIERRNKLRFMLRPGASRRYYGFHVTLFRNYPKQEQGRKWV